MMKLQFLFLFLFFLFFSQDVNCYEENIKQFNSTTNDDDRIPCCSEPDCNPSTQGCGCYCCEYQACCPPENGSCAGSGCDRSC